MGAWGFVVNVLGPVGVGLLLIALGWAAIERGSIHDQLRQLRRESRHGAVVDAGGWRAERPMARLLRFARRPRRIHLVVGMVAGWV